MESEGQSNQSGQSRGFPAQAGAKPEFAGARPGFDERGLPVGYVLKGEWEVTPRQTAAMLAGASKPLLLDCRLLEEWEVCRIDGAKLFPMQSIVQQAEDVEDAAGGKDKAVVVYCHHGRRSLQVTATLRGLGFTDVKSMAGGIDLWSVDIDGEVRRY